MQCYQCEEHTTSLNDRSRCTTCQSNTDTYNYQYYRRQIWERIRGIQDNNRARLEITRWLEITDWLDKYEAAIVKRVGQAATDYVCNRAA